MDITGIALEPHAIERYCLRVHNDEKYYLKHPEVINEIYSRLKKTWKSNLKPDRVLGYNAKRGKGKKKNIELWVDRNYVYAFRGRVLFTVIARERDVISNFCSWDLRERNRRRKGGGGKP